MSMTNSRLWSVAALALAVAGCSVRPEAAGPLPQLVPAAAVVDNVTITGTYDGTLKESLGSKSRSGSCEITLTQSGKSVKGSADVHFNSGKSYDFTISGSVESDKKKVAKLSLTITDNKGSSGTGSATIRGKKIRGKGTYTGSQGTYDITFTAKRKKN